METIKRYERFLIEKSQKAIKSDDKIDELCAIQGLAWLNQFVYSYNNGDYEK